MWVRKGLVVVLATVALCAVAVARSGAFDISSCQSALEKLRKAARDGEDASSMGESDCDRCDSCRRDDESNCASACRSCASARESVNLALMGVESAVRSVAMSCDHQFELDPRKGLEKMQRLLDQMKKKSGATTR